MLNIDELDNIVIEYLEDSDNMLCKLVNHRYYNMIHQPKNKSIKLSRCLYESYNMLDYIMRNYDFTFSYKTLARVCRYGNYNAIVKMHTFQIINDVQWECQFSRLATIECIQYGSLPALSFLINNGYEYNASTMEAAALHGDLECMKYLHKRRCKWSYDVLNNALTHNHIHCYNYAIQNGCKIVNTTLITASLHGHLDILKDLHINKKVELKWKAASYAALNGHINCLEYVLDNGVDVNGYVCSYAIESGRLEMLKYAISKNCPLTKYAIINAVRFDRDNMYSYIINNVDIDINYIEILFICAKYNSIKCLQITLNKISPEYYNAMRGEILSKMILNKSTECILYMFEHMSTYKSINELSDTIGWMSMHACVYDVLTTLIDIYGCGFDARIINRLMIHIFVSDSNKGRIMLLQKILQHYIENYYDELIVLIVDENSIDIFKYIDKSIFTCDFVNKLHKYAIKKKSYKIIDYITINYQCMIDNKQ